MANEQRIAYFNGEFLPENEVRVSFRDRGFLLGDAVFDSSRTFGGELFRLEDHVARLYRSMRSVTIPAPMPEAELIEISRQVLHENKPLLAEGEDYWVSQRVTRGPNIVGGDLWQSGRPTVIVECTPIPFKSRATLFRDGIDVFIPSWRRTPPQSLSPNVKSHNYLNLVLADREIRDRSPNAWAILLDQRGFLTEGIGSNLFVVSDGRLLTPRSQYVLAGVTRATIIELAEKLGIDVIEDDLSVHDLMTADEAFVTSTSFCLCPVRSVSNNRLRCTEVPGPISRALSDAFAKLVDYDFVGQYLRHLM